MGEEAAFSYLRALREQQGLTQEQVVAKMGTATVRLLQRWESRTNYPSTENLGHWIRAVSGSADIFFALLLDDNGGEEQGRSQALQQLVQGKLTELQQVLDDAQLSDDELVELVDSFIHLRQNSAEQARLLLDYMSFLKKRQK